MSNRKIGRTGVAVSIAILAASAAALPNYGGWSAPVNLESMPGASSNLNSSVVDGCASHSRNGLELYFNSNRDGNQEIYRATRPDTASGWGDPVKLPAPINTTANESCPTIANGGRLYFSSDREDAAYDIYVSKSGPQGWSEPENLGPNINRIGWLDETPSFYEDSAGNQVMVYSSRLPNGTQGKIYESVNGGMRSLVAGGVHSSASDNRPSVTRDGLTIYWDSTRIPALGPELFVASRSSTSQPFGTAEHLSALGGAGFDARPYISWTGDFLTFASARGGNNDMFITQRTKVTGKP